MMDNSTTDYVVLNVGKYGVVPQDSSPSSPSGGSINHGILDKVRSKFVRGGGSEKNISNKHGVESGAGDWL